MFVLWSAPGGGVISGGVVIGRGGFISGRGGLQRHENSPNWIAIHFFGTFIVSEISKFLSIMILACGKLHAMQPVR